MALATTGTCTFRPCGSNSRGVTIRGDSTWVEYWRVLSQACLWEVTTALSHRTTSTSNAGFDTPKATSAAFMATATLGCASSTKALHCWRRSMRMWRILDSLLGRTYGPTGASLLRHVNGRPCIAARSCARRVQSKIVLCSSQTWNAGILRALSFAADRCFFMQTSSCAYPLLGEGERAG